MASDFLLRGTRAFYKGIAGSARMNGRTVAEPLDVDNAADVFEEKMNFLQMIEPSFSPVHGWKGTPNKEGARQIRIVEHFGGTEVKIDSLCDMFKGVGRRTLIRDLHIVGARPKGRGYWLIPGAKAS
jgi:hypothetical protein